MPRFFFNIRAGAELIRDEEGMELPSAEAARTEARESARDILVEALRSKQDPDGQVMEITDESGAIVDTYKVRDILKRKNG